MALSHSIIRKQEDDVPFAIVIDDDPDMADEVAEAVALPRGSIILADSLPAALQVIEENPTIELVITDYYLTQDQDRYRNGEQLIDCLTCMYPDRHFEFVVISGDPYCFYNLREREMVTCQEKPLIPDVLTNILIGKDIPGRYVRSILKSRRRAAVTSRSETVVLMS